MQPSLEKLRKFFRLEHENGYANSAIIGGLAKMLDYWEGEARADGVQEEVIQAVVQRLRSYDGLSPQSRADALKGLWKRIGETYPEAQQRQRGAPNNRRPESSPDAHRAEVRQPVAPTAERAERQAPEQKTPLTLPPPEAEQAEPQKQERAQRPVPPPRSESIAGAKTSATPAALDAKLTILQGIGPKHAETLSRLGLQ